MKDAIWEEFYNQFDETTRWNDLDNKTKEKVLNCRIQFLNRIITFGECIELLDESRQISFLDEHMNQESLRKILSDDVTLLVQNIVPEVPEYYIPRTVIIRRRLDPKIFQETVSDIFVILDITLPEISKLAHFEKWDCSSAQKRHPSVRFIQLELVSHFGRIAKSAINTPVHLIRKVNDDYIWMRTHGNLRLIQAFVHHEQESVSEAECLTDHPNNDAICFAEHPGMGKSLLLASLCSSVLEKNEIAFYFSLPDLIRNWQTDAKSTSEIIINSVTNCDFGAGFVRFLLETENNTVYVFVDGFDEV